MGVGRARVGNKRLGWFCPPIMIGGDKQILRWSRPLPSLGEGPSGCQLPGWLVGVPGCMCACAYVCMCESIDGDLGVGMLQSRALS